MVRALVTGGAGFIGSSIARALLAEGAEVRILDNFITGFEANVPPEAELIRGDLRDARTVEGACREIALSFTKERSKTFSSRWRTLLSPSRVTPWAL
jgi:UDP-glucose 4-epimerase